MELLPHNLFFNDVHWDKVLNHLNGFQYFYSTMGGMHSGIGCNF
jgi:hypothetical protein